MLSLFLFGLSACLKGPTKGPEEWTLSGKVTSKNSVKINLNSGKLLIGAFSANSSPYLPQIDDIAPDAGWALVGTDSSFSLKIDTRGIEAPLIYVFVWFDFDQDGLLDAESEPFSMPLEQTDFRGTPVGYVFNEIQNSWMANGIESATIKNLRLVVDRDLVGSSVFWQLQGKLFPEKGFSIDYTSGRVKIGAFQSSVSAFVPEIDGINPESGLALLENDSMFSMAMDVRGVNAPFIYLFAWYDENDNDKLDAVTEHFSIVQIPSRSQDALFLYRYNASTGVWINLGDESTGADRQGLELSVRGNLVPLLDSWIVQGRLYPEAPAEIDIKNGHIKIGAFSSAAQAYVPADNGIGPAAGIAGVEADSTFTLDLNAEDIEEDYLSLFAWHDGNENGKLDAQAEPFSRLYSGSSALYFAFDHGAREWVNIISLEPAGDLLNMDFLTAASLLSDRHSWVVEGRIFPEASYEMEPGEGRIHVGVFGYAGQSFTPTLNNIEPGGGSSIVAADSSFFIQVDVNGSGFSGLSLFAWYDTDADGLLDALNEPFGRLRIQSLSRSDYFTYVFNAAQGLWEVPVFRQTARDNSGLELFFDRNLIPFRSQWVLGGSVHPVSEKDTAQVLDFASGRMMMGAFPYSQSTYYPALNDITPEAGITAVSIDSTFSLALGVENVEEEYVHVFLWYDSDGDGRLDAGEEPYEAPLEGNRFGGQKIYYRHDRQEIQWEAGLDGIIAGDALTLSIYARSSLSDP